MSGERGWEGVQVRKTERERLREPALRVKEKKERNGDEWGERVQVIKTERERLRAPALKVLLYCK